MAAKAASPSTIGSQPMALGGGGGAGGTIVSATGAGGGGAVTGNMQPGAAPAWTAAEAAAVAAVEPAQIALRDAALASTLIDTRGSTALSGNEVA
jgi:hypothetical protein